MTVLGIDFGTTNSVVATWTSTGPEVLSIDEPLGEWLALGFDRVMPSVYARTSSGGSLFGWAAKRHSEGRFEAVKRLFATQQDVVTDDAGEAFAVEEVATLLFGHMRATAAAQGVDASRAVVTVPSNSRGLARHRTKICAGMAGLEVLALINEPTAAAMTYAQRNAGDQQLLVFDWGGGTLDVTVLRSVGGVFMEQASKGLPTRGGLDFDSRLRKLVLESSANVSDWSAADRHDLSVQIELAKIRLSDNEFTVIQLPDGETRRITRSAFETAVMPLIEQSRSPIEQCLRDIGAGSAGIDAVVMVGGTSKIPAVRRFVADLVGVAPEVGVDPMTAVGEGAAVAAAILTGESDEHDFFVATEHALGTVTLDAASHELEFSVLIPRNHKLPAKRSEVYSPIFDGQETVEIDVVEGDPEQPLDHHDTVKLKSWNVELPWRVDGDRSFTITYEYDVDGILHVTVVDNESNQVLLRDGISYGITADRREMVQMAKRARDVIETGRASNDASVDVDDPRAAALLQKTWTKVVPFLDDEEAEQISTLATSLQNAVPADRTACADRLEAAIRPFSYLF